MRDIPHDPNTFRTTITSNFYINLHVTCVKYQFSLVGKLFMHCFEHKGVYQLSGDHSPALLEIQGSSHEFNTQLAPLFWLLPHTCVSVSKKVVSQPNRIGIYLQQFCVQLLLFQSKNKLMVFHRNYRSTIMHCSYYFSSGKQNYPQYLNSFFMYKTPSGLAGYEATSGQK